MSKIDIIFTLILALLIMAGLGLILFHPPSEGNHSHSHPPALPPSSFGGVRWH